MFKDVVADHRVENAVAKGGSDEVHAKHHVGPLEVRADITHTPHLEEGGPEVSLRRDVQQALGSSKQVGPAPQIEIDEALAVR
jgi:hypothetical protein